jgi:ferric-dicitrate binding protein FerR (iron transport regulator)
MSKIIRRTLLGLVGLVVLAAAAFLWVVGPRNVMGMLRYDQRREGDLRVGVPAPDVSLVALDGRTPVRIANSIGKQPLVIVFGSYT